MIRRSRQSLVLISAALLLALASIGFAARMAPEAASAQGGLGAYLAMGGSLEDLCADGLPGHDHDCPLCRLLSDPPDMAPPVVALRLRCAFGAVPLADLRLSPRRGNPHVAPRAPPALG